jgi:hypothetical protein
MADILTRDAILTVDDRRFVEVPIPEWGGTVRLSSLTAAQLLEYHEIVKKPGGDHVAWLLVASLVDAAGERLLGPEHAAKLQEKSPAVVLRLYHEAAKLNVLTAEAAEEQRGN